ncbi:Hypothetical protein, putative, partial [Bodo saltans]
PGGDDIETWTHYTCYGGVTTWNQFTQSNSTRLGSCVFYSSQTQCDNDPKCQWYSDIRSNQAAQCWPSSCVSTYCTQASCAQNPQCYWNTTEQLCGRFVCPSYFNLTACLAVSTKWCAYDQTSLTPAGWYCRNKYCLTRGNFWSCIYDSCIYDEHNCVWDTIQNWRGVCREPYCPFTNETVCKQHAAQTVNVSVGDTNVCVWETRFGSPKCRENSCIQYNAVYNSPQLEAFCNNNGACKVYQNTTPIPATTYCDEDWCGAYPTEAYCNRDLLCTWDIVVSPSTCRDTTCGRWSTSQTLCDSSDVTCAWNSAVVNAKALSTAPAGTVPMGICVSTQCWQETTSCNCYLQRDCFWTGPTTGCRNFNYYKTASADIDIFIDTSANFQAFIGRFPVGTVGALGFLKQWIQEIPLTNTSASNMAVGTVPGVRLNFYQFCGTAVKASPQIPAGYFSGNRTQLLNALLWHETNLPSPKSAGVTCRVSPAVAQAASDFVNANQVNPTRRRIMLQITTSTYTDATAAGATTSILNNLNVLSYGAVIRLFPDPSQAVAAAITAMGTVVGSGDVYNIQLSELKTSFLINLQAWTRNDVVDQFGTTVTALNYDRNGPCSELLNNSLLCNRDPYCIFAEQRVCLRSTECPNLQCNEPTISFPYQPYRCEQCQITDSTVQCSYFWAASVQYSTIQCRNSQCSLICDQPSCSAATGCRWNMTTSQCQRQICNYTTSSTCNADISCEWDLFSKTCGLNRCTLYQDLGSIVQYSTIQCRNSQCSLICDQPSCSAATGCRWNMIWAASVQYSTIQCRNSQCSLICDQPSCSAATGCRWNMTTSQCQRQICNYTTSSTCNADISCEWDLFSSTCGLNRCTLYQDVGNCTHLTDATTGLNLCVWNQATLLGPQCVNNPCRTSSSVECLTLGNGQCTWDTTSNPSACRRLPCLYTTEAPCTNDYANKCQWITANGGQCRVAMCQYTNKTLCAADNTCRILSEANSLGTPIWSCRERLCQYNYSGDCMNDINCDWVNGVCTENACTLHVNEDTCDRDTRCFWNMGIAPSLCTRTPCAYFGPNASTCALLTGAPYSCKFSNGVCVNHTCSDYTDSCTCMANPNCYYSFSKSACVQNIAVGCAPVDMIVVFGEKGRLGYPIARHPNGYLGLLEMFRRFLRIAPLTGDKAGAAMANNLMPGL